MKRKLRLPSIKPEFPAFWAKASTWAATPIIGLVAILYVSGAISRPASEIYGIGIAAFGLTAALSAICFSVSETWPGSSNFRYAGEKFLHSSVLLVQTLMLLYLNESLAGSTWLTYHLWVGRIVRGVPRSLFGLLSGAAAIAWHQGFGVVDWQLWENWKQRVEELKKPTRGKEKNQNA